MAGPFADRKPEARTLGVREFRTNITAVLREAQQGNSFVITSRGQVVAEIHPPSATPRPRRVPGALRGRIRLAADFDVLPSDVLTAMEGEAE